MKKNLGDAPLTLGGWLILVGIRLIGGIYVNSSPFMQPLNLHLNETGQIIKILSLICIVYVLVVSSLFFKRHKAFPLTYIVLEIVLIILNTSLFFTNITVLETSWIFYAVAMPLINILWILYILLSKRVKKTFVYKWNETLDQSLVDKANCMEENK